MGFVKVKGLKGTVYVPDQQADCCKKYPCRDCFSCERCSDDRCRVCRESGGDKITKNGVPDG